MNPTNMKYFGEMSECCTNLTTLSRLQEKEELKHLNDRFLEYIRRVRQLGENAYNAESASFLNSTKILEDEIISLKILYESELQRLRKEIEEISHERNILLMQNNKNQQCIEELQNRLVMERENNQKFLNENKMLQKNNMTLQAEIQNAKLALAEERSEAKVEQLYRTVKNLTLEEKEWKQRYEFEKCKGHQAEDKLQQLLKKIEFSDQIQKQQITDYQTRLDTAAASILSLESKISELTKTDMPVAELFKQMRESTKLEMKQYRIESEEIYSQNISVLKAQIDNDADTIKSLTKEKQAIIESISELHAKIRNLEGQLSNLEHQKETLENVLLAERSQSAVNIVQLEKKFRDVQDQLVTQMREISIARESNLPLRSEIDALKILLEEEEQRLNAPLDVMSASVVQSSQKYSTSTSKILSPQVMHALPSTLFDQQQANNMLQSFEDARKAKALQLTTVPSQNLSPSNNTENSTSLYGPGQGNSLYPSEPSSVQKTKSPLDELQPVEEKNRNITYDQHTQEFSLPMNRPGYHYESTPSISRVFVEGDQHQITKTIGPVPSRIKSAPVSFERNVHESKDGKITLKTNKLSQEDFKMTDEDTFKKLFNDLKQETLFPKQRPKSSPPGTSFYSTLHDYNAKTSNSLNDLKIAEVSHDGKYVRLLNDDALDVEIGGFIIQQNVGGHPVAAFRFPSQTKFPADSTITIWAGVNDSQIHNPPHEFYWKELFKWGAGSETTTILCQPNGQAVAWCTSAHRLSKDAYIDTDKSSNKNSTDERHNIKDDEKEILTEPIKDLVNIKSEPIFLRREKQQPQSLSAAKHPHGHAPNASIHPHVNLQSNIRKDNYTCDNGSQVKTWNDHSDLIQDRSSWSTSQKMGSAPLRKMGGNQGLVSPSPFMKPQSRLSFGLAQINSQQELDFLPPMPRPQQTSW